MNTLILTLNNIYKAKNIEGNYEIFDSDILF